MGQYYKTVIVSSTCDCEKKIVTVDNDCNFPEYIGLKLMEHSYLNNDWTDSIANIMFNNKIRMAHVGDYAYEYPQYELAYNKHISSTPFDTTNMYNEDNILKEFDYSGKYLINWDRKLYISFDKYKEKSHSAWSDEVYICPFTLLTALGNGRGGGDYHDCYPNADLVGSWAWEEISIENQVPEGFTDYPIYFTEEE